MRKIITTYSFRRTETKVNRAATADSAIMRAVWHMQHNSYCASIAQVSCAETGKLYCIITRNMRGEIRLLYKAEGLFVMVDNRYQSVVQEKKAKLAGKKDAVKLITKAFLNGEEKTKKAASKPAVTL